MKRLKPLKTLGMNIPHSHAHPISSSQLVLGQQCTLEGSRQMMSPDIFYVFFGSK